MDYTRFSNQLMKLLFFSIISFLLYGCGRGSSLNLRVINNTGDTLQSIEFKDSYDNVLSSTAVLKSGGDLAVRIFHEKELQLYLTYDNKEYCSILVDGYIEAPGTRNYKITLRDNCLATID